jgi:ribulose-phosphate 3-epimerase
VRKSGFGGQNFIADMGQKVRRIREMTDLPRGADGGITAETAPLVVEVGAQVLAGGSAVYKGDPASEIRKIIEAGRRAARR